MLKIAAVVTIYLSGLVRFSLGGCMVSKSFSSRFHCERASTFLEFAIGLPIFILLIAGFADGLSFGYYRLALNHAAQEGLRKGIELQEISEIRAEAELAARSTARVFGVAIDYAAADSVDRGELGEYLRLRVVRTVPFFLFPKKTIEATAEGSLDTSA